MWLEHSKMLINEYRLDLMSPKAQQILREQCEQYFFGEGAALPPDSSRPRRSSTQRSVDILLSRRTSSGTSRCTWPRRWRFLSGGGDRGARDRSGRRPARRSRRSRDAAFVAIAVPMHTALRLGAEVGARVRALNPRAHLCFFGLYAPLNRELSAGAWRRFGHRRRVRGGARRARRAAGAAPGDVVARSCSKLSCRARARGAAAARSLCALAKRPTASASPATSRRAAAACTTAATARFRRSTAAASSSCRVDVVLADVAAQVAAGARHVTFGDPDFLNGPEHALAVARAHPRRASRR